MAAISLFLPLRRRIHCIAIVALRWFPSFRLGIYAMRGIAKFVLALLVAAASPIGIVFAEDYYSFLTAAENPVADAADKPAYSELTPISSQDEINESNWLSDPSSVDYIQTTMQPAPLIEWADYRMRTMFASHTTYQFGTSPQDPGPQYAPLSKLNWSLDSMWQGLQIGFEKPRWGAHFEWLTPMLHNSFGEMSDYDWSGADRAPALLSVSPQHWTDAQTIEIEGEYKLFDRIFTLPVAFWSIAGYRYQRFGMMAYNGVQVINDGTMPIPDIPPVGYRWHEETVSLNQEYHMGYVGGQLRTTWYVSETRSVDLTLQGDWAGTSGHNVDHHISGYEAQDIHRYTIENTHGDAIHIALIAETPLSQHFSVGLQADHTEIRTTGTHRWLASGSGTLPIDETWSNGVKVTSDQISITAFLRAQF
jgi:hypothetical protein